MGLAAFVIGFGFLIWGASSQGWWFGQFSAVFFWIAVVTGAIYGYSLNQWAGYFVDGMKDMVSGAVAVGFAKAISVILADGVIIDTVVYYLAKPLEVLPGMITSAGMMVVQTIINLGVPSGSAQAAVTMPIVVPLSDLLGVSRQTAVFAFQCGDGISNCLIPTYTSMITYLAASRLQYKKLAEICLENCGSRMAGRPPDDGDCGGYRVLTNTGRVLSGAVWRGVNSNQNPASQPEAGFFFTFEKIPIQLL